MTLKQWELYRLSVAEQMPNSAYKTAVLNAITHSLMMLERHPENAFKRPTRAGRS